MTTKPRIKTKYPIESFGPALMEALKRGSREPVVLKFEGADGSGKKMAHNFQRRIHTLRQRMREFDHPDYTIATRARVSIFWGEKAVANGGPRDWELDDQGLKGAIIVIRPQDTEFADVLSAAGIGSPAQPIPPPIPVKIEADSALDDLLSELDASKIPGIPEPR